MITLLSKSQKVCCAESRKGDPSFPNKLSCIETKLKHHHKDIYVLLPISNSMDSGNDSFDGESVEVEYIEESVTEEDVEVKYEEDYVLIEGADSAGTVPERFPSHCEKPTSPELEQCITPAETHNDEVPAIEEVHSSKEIGNDEDESQDCESPSNELNTKEESEKSSLSPTNDPALVQSVGVSVSNTSNEAQIVSVIETTKKTRPMLPCPRLKLLNGKNLLGQVQS